MGAFVLVLLSSSPLFLLYVDPYEAEFASYVEAAAGDVSAVPSAVAAHHLPVILAGHLYMLSACVVGSWLLTQHIKQQSDTKKIHAKKTT